VINLFGREWRWPIWTNRFELPVYVEAWVRSPYCC